MAEAAIREFISVLNNEILDLERELRIKNSQLKLLDTITGKSLDASGSLRENVIAVLSDGARMTTPEIKEELEKRGVDFAHNSIYGTISYLATEGILNRHEATIRGGGYRYSLK